MPISLKIGEPPNSYIVVIVCYLVFATNHYCGRNSAKHIDAENRLRGCEITATMSATPTEFAVSYTYNGAVLTNLYTYDEASDEFWADDSHSRIGYHKHRKRYVMYEANGETAP